MTCVVRRKHLHAARVVVALFLGIASCSGTSERPESSGSPGPGSGPAPGSPSDADLIWPVRYSGQPSSVRRLSRDEIVTSMWILTGQRPLREELPPEVRPGDGPLLTSGTSFIASELATLKRVIDDFAAETAPGVLDHSGCKGIAEAQKGCLLAWATNLAERALRRPLRSGESTRFQQIFDAAGATREDDIASIESLLQAIFFSPSFLYRFEVGAPVPDKPGVRALGSDEVATRLSYLATLGPPDVDLLVAASAGQLGDADERARQFDRLAKTSQGRHALAVFVLEWLGANEGKVSQKSARYLVGLPANFVTALRSSAENAIGKVVGVSSDDSTVGNLLSTSTYLGDEPVLALTQPAGMGAAATGDPNGSTRLGLMMHPQVVSAHTKEDGASPFPIGKFMREAFLCQPVTPPPPNAADMAKTDEPPGLSQRQSLEYKTSEPQCNACHAQFSPLGYALLPFDPLGRWRKRDPSGKPWDLSGTIETASGGPLAFASPAALMKQLAARPQVHGCFAQAALERALGRGLIEEDRPLVLVINEAAKQTRGGVLALFRAIVSAPEFITTTAPRSAP